MKQCLYILLFASLFCGCKKYSEDDKHYLERPEGRLKRTWYLHHIWMNGGDSISKLLNHCGIPSKADIYSDITFSSFFGKKFKAMEHSPGCNSYDGSWTFSSDKKELILYANDFWPYDALGFNGTVWTIRKLTKTEMKLAGDANGITYILELSTTH